MASDSELISWLIATLRSQNLKMDGKSTWYFPSNLLFKFQSRDPREALEQAHAAYREDVRQYEQDHPEQSF